MPLWYEGGIRSPRAIFCSHKVLQNICAPRSSALDFLVRSALNKTYAHASSQRVPDAFSNPSRLEHATEPNTWFGSGILCAGGGISLLTGAVPMSYLTSPCRARCDILHRFESLSKGAQAPFSGAHSRNRHPMCRFLVVRREGFEPP